eukprot:TRINITY_DN1289_c0_g4_i2.p1 TRINITY_DN1289_c0_g4~~TRINITY_DN1289_c0_g4_i2.p1  ORF type:complete len:364 (+),score=69.66 TRINITY_DN1289_c0_g4_i2:172-1263(+)
MNDRDKWERLQNLKNLLEEGFITRTEFDERKAQLIDDLTGTSISTISSTASKTRTHRKSRRSSSSTDSDPQVIPLPSVVPHLPNFVSIPTEMCNKFTYDIETGQWIKSTTTIKLDPVPFSRGALRFVYHLKDLSADTSASYVAKMSFDPRDNADRSVYFKDIEMQCYAREYAKKFNKYNPPKKVDFVAAWILELVQRPSKPICGVERFIEGPYRKHNNNYGYVSEDERNTPQAFSHFSYEASGHTVLICDIQGVGDLYTDPQMHSIDGKGFGKGNLGKRGFDKFLQTHRCNRICQYLKLPPINPNYAAVGTLPATRFMANTHVDQEAISLKSGAAPVHALIDPSTPILQQEPPKETCCQCIIL